MSDAEKAVLTPEAAVSSAPSTLKRLIVVTFDHLAADSAAAASSVLSKVALPEHIADKMNLSGDSGSISAFDVLDLQSVFFEQHYSQDLRDGQSLLTSLGASSEFERLGQFLKSSDLTFRFLRLEAGGNCETFSDPEILPRLPATALITPNAQSDSLDTILMSCPDVHLLWIHVQNGNHELGTSTGEADPFVSEAVVPEEGRVLAAERVLHGVLQRQQRISVSSEQPVRLLVTALRGTGRRVAAPFESSFAEDLAHVPLWIDRGGCESSRIASISGSLGIVAAILELLSDDHSHPCHLLTLCESSTESPAVTLPIYADGCAALRTLNLLIVRQQLSDALDTNSDCTADRRPADGAESARFRYALYLKPEDVWNVHDQSEVYQKILEDYVVRWPELHPVTSGTPSRAN